MTDREQAIATLTEHLNHWKRLLSEGICCEVEGKQTIDALEFAIESIKVDRAYDLAYEKVDFIEIPEGVTNGEMIKALFPNAEYSTDNCTTYYMRPLNEQGEWGSRFGWSFDIEWWNSPYRKEN